MGFDTGIKIADFEDVMHFVEMLWMNMLNLVEQAIVKRTYLDAIPPSGMPVLAPLVAIGILLCVSRFVFRTVRYVAFTAVCGAAFYFLLRTL